ncbi:MAG TPA: hypothetical protein VIL28_07990 [Steroidobacteraceae bacterium]
MKVVHRHTIDRTAKYVELTATTPADFPNVASEEPYAAMHELQTCAPHLARGLKKQRRRPDVRTCPDLRHYQGER